MKLLRCVPSQRGSSCFSPRFKYLQSPNDFKYIADQFREVSSDIPIGFKTSANHIEKSIDFALATSLDDRGGGTGAAPLIFRNNISISTILALARVRKYLDSFGYRKDITLIITGGLQLQILLKLCAWELMVLHFLTLLYRLLVV